MPDVRDLFYHGVRHQIRRVLDAMGTDRIDAGLTAFEDGASNWASCFFARAYPELRFYSTPQAEYAIAEALGMGTNRVPMRIVYRTFDGYGIDMTKEQLRSFIEAIRDESRPDEVLDLLRSIDYTDTESTPADFSTVCSTH